MNPVEVISASAGSGKTARLAKHLAAEIGEGRVRPEAVVAVTFTVKAAAELARRVREELLRHGKVDEARRLGAARIGTVHSVCGRLLSDFAFDLGLSPDLHGPRPGERRRRPEAEPLVRRHEGGRGEPLRAPVALPRPRPGGGRPEDPGSRPLERNRRGDRWTSSRTRASRS